ncbi:hypothetical protein P9X77_16135 [Bacillus cereus]|uniref:hypothetical protein n=1 Tax=Bacillus cereus group sp. BfR-BA-01353 TaxID=2920316 RepID=UPI001F58F31E|nr:hypothetical protein [Bacillus cereus group sp. BfR-BA-01353]MEC2974058.1 hypothetical protein [Bacillus cereus]
MEYKWEKESLQKYGEEATQILITKQKKYEALHKDNNCEYCGKKNEGTLIEIGNGIPFIMHYGMWSSSGRCGYCGEFTGRRTSKI